MQIEFSTEQYEFSNGKKPRGTGVWAFYFGGSGRWTADLEFTPYQMSFSAAKAWAAKRARALGCSTVVVGA